MSKITTKNGLLYRDGNEIELPEADRVARACGFPYAENFVHALEENPNIVPQESAYLSARST